MPADELYGLTKDDVAWLKEVRTRLGSLLQNNPSAKLSELLLDTDPPAPETYIALVGESGIPAATGDPYRLSGTGTDSTLDNIEGDIPGSAECDIYRIVRGSLHPVFLRKVVYNLSSSAVSQGWITVVRDKFGSWIAQVGGGSVELSHGRIIDACNVSCNTYLVRRIRRVITSECQ